MAQTTEVRGVATSIRTEAGKTIIRYHSTDVVRFDDKEIILDSGGWQTVTTKLRMNQAAHQFGLGFGVFQKKGEWFVDAQGETIPFHDGMTIRRA